uniref:Uncharacterized protein n=1 Tax=Timema shepardi TaxID=629360 RepID=A0A7R9B6X9_TIMSH|nr:unnamed protein product [Timema shepardi]
MHIEFDILTHSTSRETSASSPLQPIYCNPALKEELLRRIKEHDDHEAWAVGCAATMDRMTDFRLKNRQTGDVGSTAAMDFVQLSIIK